MYENRILNSEMRNLVMSAEEAAAKIRSGMVIATSGFGTGYPKAIPTALSESGHAKDLTLINGAARGDLHVGAMAKAGILSRGYGFQYNDTMRAAVNEGGVLYSDIHLGQFIDKIKRGVFGHIDVAVIECCKIREDGASPTIRRGITKQSRVLRYDP
jgi:succinyl-CoA:acetate CoA-transferase